MDLGLLIIIGMSIVALIIFIIGWQSHNKLETKYDKEIAEEMKHHQQLLRKVKGGK